MDTKDELLVVLFWLYFCEGIYPPVSLGLLPLIRGPPFPPFASFSQMTKRRYLNVFLL